MSEVHIELVEPVIEPQSVQVSWGDGVTASINIDENGKITADMTGVSDGVNGRWLLMHRLRLITNRLSYFDRDVMDVVANINPPAIHVRTDHTLRGDGSDTSPLGLA